MTVKAHPAGSLDQGLYLPGMRLDDYRRHIRHRHPALEPLLDLRPETVASAHRWFELPNEFENDHGTGRGDSYRTAQLAGQARLTGIRTLFQLAGCLSADTGGVVLDVFGGDGVLARAWRTISAERRRRLSVVTGDLSGQMVRAALDAGLPAVRQPAQQLLVRDGVVDAVIMAYGTHHVPDADRALALVEAARVLAPGGRLVVHDFEEESAVARWFRDVVHRYAKAGHRHRHFTRQSLRDLLVRCGFANVRISSVYDPFRLRGATPRGALATLAEHICAMYGLHPTGRQVESAEDRQVWIQDLMTQYFRVKTGELAHWPGRWVRELTVYPVAGGYVAELPRVALTAACVRP